MHTYTVRMSVVHAPCIRAPNPCARRCFAVVSNVLLHMACASQTCISCIYAHVCVCVCMLREYYKVYILISIMNEIFFSLAAYSKFKSGFVQSERALAHILDRSALVALSNEHGQYIHIAWVFLFFLIFQ